MADLTKVMSQPIDSSMVGRGKLHPAGWDPGWAAAIALGRIAPGTPAAGEAIKALIAVVRSGHPYRRVAAAHALSDFGPAAAAAIPALIDVVQANATAKADLADGANAATALGKIAPGTPLADEAMSCLIGRSTPNRNTRVSKPLARSRLLEKKQSSRCLGCACLSMTRTQPFAQPRPKRSTPSRPMTDRFLRISLSRKVTPHELPSRAGGMSWEYPIFYAFSIHQRAISPQAPGVANRYTGSRFLSALCVATGLLRDGDGPHRLTYCAVNGLS